MDVGKTSRFSAKPQDWEVPAQDFRIHFLKKITKNRDGWAICFRNRNFSICKMSKDVAHGFHLYLFGEYCLIY